MKFLLLILLSAFFFAQTYASAPNEFGPLDVGLLVCLAVIVFGLEVLIAYQFARHRNIQNLILAGLATANILSVNLVLNEAFLNLPGYAILLALLLALFILFSFMKMVDEDTLIGKLLLVSIVFATVGVLGQTILTLEPTLSESTTPGQTSAENIQFVDFKNKPNVYFLAFDSILPKTLLQKHLGLESTPYHVVLDTHFRSFNNFFADQIWTKRSINSLLALDLSHFSKAKKEGTMFDNC